MFSKEKEQHEKDVKETRKFFTRKTCERCHKYFDGARIMSMFNTQVICMWCKDVEELHPDYEKARKAERDEYRKGNAHFEGIGVDINELKRIERGC